MVLGNSFVTWLLTGYPVSFNDLPLHIREQILLGWRDSFLEPLRSIYQLFKRLVSGHFMAYLNDQRVFEGTDSTPLDNPSWKDIGYDPDTSRSDAITAGRPSHPEELVAQAISLGLTGLGIADRNSVAGVVRAHVFLRENREKAGAFRVVSGCRLVLTDGTPDLVVYPRDRAAWGRLCRLLTRGRMRAEKGDCRLALADVLDHAEGQQVIVLEHASREDIDGSTVAEARRRLPERLDRLRAAAQGRVWLALRRGYDGEMRDALAPRVALAHRLRLPLI
eukprot:gene33363-38769_t